MDVQDRHDVAIAENRGAGKRPVLAQRVAQLFEDELLLLVHRVDQQPERRLAGTRHEHRLARRRPERPIR